MVGADRDRGAEYLRALARVARRARLAVVLRRLVPGALAGLAAGFAYLVARPFLPPAFTPVHPLLVPGLLLAAGAAAGTAAGFAVSISRSALAVEADRSLGTRGLASAALEVAEGRCSTWFAGVLLEEAASALRRAGPRGVIARPRLRLLPWTLAAAALVAAVGLLPYTLRDLLPVRPAIDREMAVLAGELEESGRRLELESRRQDLRGGLELSRELQQLGRDLKMQQGSAEEVSQRLSEMQKRIGREYQLMLQRFNEASEPAGAGERTGSAGARSETVPGQGHDDGAGGSAEAVDPSALPPEARELAQALELLRQLEEGSRRSGEESGPGRRGGQTGDRDAEGQGAGTADEAAGDAGNRDGSPRAGTTAVPDEPGPPTEIVAAKPGEPLRAESPIGEGDMARMLVRALPESTGAATSEEAALGAYRRQAESALAAEQVPLALREYLKRYFTSIGVLP